MVFQHFEFQRPGDVLEIGDGLLYDNATSLARFSGSTLPSNVTSVSNALWILMKSTFESCCRIPTLEISLLAIPLEGKNVFCHHFCLLRSLH